LLLFFDDVFDALILDCMQPAQILPALVGEQCRVFRFIDSFQLRGQFRRPQKAADLFGTRWRKT
jgi:hypothetical protein